MGERHHILTKGHCSGLVLEKIIKIKFGWVKLRKYLNQASFKDSPECLKKHGRCILMHRVHWRLEGDSKTQLRWLWVHSKQFFWYFAWFTIFVEWGEASDIRQFAINYEVRRKPSRRESWRRMDRVSSKGTSTRQNPRIMTNRPMQSWRVVTTR